MIFFMMTEAFVKTNISGIIKQMYLFIETINKKIPIFNRSQSFHNKHVKFLTLYYKQGRRMNGISGSLILSKTLMELWRILVKSRGPSQPNPLSSPSSWCPWDISDLLRSVQMLKREWGAECNGKLPHLFSPW